MKTKLLTLALAALTIGLLGSCKKEDPKVSVTGVTLDQTELTLTVGDDDVKLAATIAPENATDKTVSWNSDKTDVATVDNQGNVRAVAPGTATITVTTTDGNKTATCVVTVKAALPEGALPGKFTVNAEGKKVYFSKGNLYWDGDSFEFETTQYDTQSSWDASHVSYFFWSKTASVAYAEAYSDGSAADSDIFFTNAETETAKSDFTVNGVTGQYRTLSKDEWTYLINKNGEENIRKDKFKYGVTVCEKANCLILAPDDFTGTIEASYDATAWATAEAAGLVCLPAAGYRFDSSVNDVGGRGSYWSSTAYSVSLAYYVRFNSSNVKSDGNLDRSYGSSVRLITESK